MAGLPLLKLGGLAIKTLAKPVAKRLKIEATKRPTLKNLYVTVGQWTHQASAWITISSAGHKSLGVKELEEAAAFARGADFLSETLVFFVGGAILTFEYTRSNASAAQKEAAKEASRQKFREDLEARFLSLEARVIRMEERQQAGWSSVFPGSKGKERGRVALEDLPEAPHFADVETLKRKKKQQAAETVAGGGGGLKEKERGGKGGVGGGAETGSDATIKSPPLPTPTSGYDIPQIKKRLPNEGSPLDRSSSSPPKSGAALTSSPPGASRSAGPTADGLVGGRKGGREGGKEGGEAGGSVAEKQRGRGSWRAWASSFVRGGGDREGGKGGEGGGGEGGGGGGGRGGRGGIDGGEGGAATP
jgi:hypothetical protein